MSYKVDLAAIKTLEGMGYTYRGGEMWKPPIGNAPSYMVGEKNLYNLMDESGCRRKVGELKIDGKEHTTFIDGNIDALIAERGNRYGKFSDGATIMRDLKHVMHEVDGWNNLSPSQKEALDMIQHKIGRILNGDPNYDDNWKDVAGYAKLIADELNGDIK